MSQAIAPDDILHDHADRGAGAREPLLVLNPLIAFLERSGLAAPPDLSAVPIGDGHSCVTYALSKRARRPA
jgi:hypothetical protein